MNEAVKQNFWNFYKNLADEWFLYYNMEDNFQLIATGEKNKIAVTDKDSFERFSKI